MTNSVHKPNSPNDIGDDMGGDDMEEDVEEDWDEGIKDTFTTFEN
ncbi:hypothetical protein [Alteromonas genovensis]|nr:hypothetical protein [Alteromonas genovensis]